MRITRSTLRRLISEESARLLAEANKSYGRTVGANHRHGPSASFVAPPEEEGDYYDDDADPFGDDEAIEKGYDYVPGSGYKKPDAEDDYYGDEDPFGDDEALKKGVEYGPGGYDMVAGETPEDSIFDEVDVEYGDDGYDMTEGDDMMDGDDMMEGDDMMDDDGTFGGPPRVDYDGQYTTPQYVKGTPQHREMNRGPSAPSFSQVPSRGHAQGGGGMGGYGEYDSKHYGAGINESIDLVSAGIGAVVGLAALYAGGKLASVAKSILDAMSESQQASARRAARAEENSKLAAAIEELSSDRELVSLFRDLEEIAKSEESGKAGKFAKKSREITAYIKDKRKDMDFGSGGTQDVRQGVSKRLKKGDDDKLDEGRWAQLAGILKS
jgi:hypothetical protein